MNSRYDRLGGLGRGNGDEDEAFDVRRRPREDRLGCRRIGATEGGNEFVRLRSAIIHFRKGTQLSLPIAQNVPERETRTVVWWRRWQIAF